MAVTGISTDGAFVFDDIIDSRGRRVIDATARILEDGTHYFEVEAAPGPPAGGGKLNDCTRIHRCTVIT